MENYQITRKIGSGFSANIYLGTNTTTGEEIAVKLEPVEVEHS
jgi:serine/threonine protein kinase